MIKPEAMAIPRETAQLEQGKYGPIYPKTPACHGFTIIAKIIPGRGPVHSNCFIVPRSHSPR
jgi:hypothetical protein